jgi:hypothetical protein
MCQFSGGIFIVYVEAKKRGAAKMDGSTLILLLLLTGGGGNLCGDSLLPILLLSSLNQPQCGTFGAYEAADAS